MSFMFNPYPYDDPAAVNVLNAGELPEDSTIFGNDALAAALVSAALSANGVIGVDGYTTAPFNEICGLIERNCIGRGTKIEIVDTNFLFRPAVELNVYLKEKYLPEDREQDPVLLYGKLMHGGYAELFDMSKLASLKTRFEGYKNDGSVLLVIGAGALCGELRSFYGTRVFADLTSKMSALNVKQGGYKNIGCDKVLPFKQAMRRCYYVDNEAAAGLRSELMEKGEIDFYINADNPRKLVAHPYSFMISLFDVAVGYPLRCRPVYLEGVWGGYRVMEKRGLPRQMKNCAWVFDMIPMEVSIVFDVGGKQYEFPFFTFVQSQAEKLMGRESVEKFGRFFPVRFNYDDTWHSSGNMSIQCHPDEEYIKRHNGELGRQDESYYIVEAAQDAKTYIGFNNGVDVEAFITDAKRSEKDGTPVDYDKYIHAEKSVPGKQFMLPAGTVHASGRNQLILEIGSLTVGSDTYKIYDYMRKDLDGNTRPIHTYHADKTLVRSRTEDWVHKNIIQQPRLADSGKDWEEHIVGEHDLLYFSLRVVKFGASAQQDTKGKFHVLALVDGEEVLIRSIKNPAHSYRLSYLEIAVIPADMGAYEIVNLREGTRAAMHKTVLK